MPLISVVVAVGELTGKELFVGAGVSAVEGLSVGAGVAVGVGDGVVVGLGSFLVGLVTPELTTTAAKPIDMSSRKIAVVAKNWFRVCAKIKNP